MISLEQRGGGGFDVDRSLEVQRGVAVEEREEALTIDAQHRGTGERAQRQAERLERLVGDREVEANNVLKIGARSGIELVRTLHHNRHCSKQVQPIGRQHHHRRHADLLVR